MPSNQKPVQEGPLDKFLKTNQSDPSKSAESDVLPSKIKEKKESLFEKALKRQAQQLDLSIDANDEEPCQKVLVIDTPNTEVLELKNRVKLLQSELAVCKTEKQNVENSFNRLKQKHVKVLTFCYESNVKLAKAEGLMKTKPSVHAPAANLNELVTYIYFSLVQLVF